MPIPNDIDFTAFDTLTAAQMDDLIENDNALADGTAIDALSYDITTRSNPYKFSGYRNAAWTVANGSLGVVPIDTELYDTHNNFDVVTNKGRYTAPVSGFYFFSASAQSNLNNVGFGVAALFKNGSEILRGNQVFGSSTQPYGNSVSGILQLSATNYVEFAYQGVGNAGAVGVVNTWFQGILLFNT